ncbi:MAG: hypothetical protein IJP96_04795 [Synergistaceae bacterium]|nr:hypothetical protein [Synergistaceae bacterium]
MTKSLLYIHGKGGNSREVEQYKKFFVDCYCRGLDYEISTPNETRKIIVSEFEALHKNYGKVFILANSIGAHFSMLALQNMPIEKAFFISPILDMEKLIFDLMKLAGVTENELFEKGEIETNFGENLSWEYLCYVRDNKINWNVETEILYGENDNLTSLETVENFVKTHNANLTIMKNGEHWFHTPEQMEFLYKWLERTV